MPKDYGRHERVAGAVQRGLAQLLGSEVNDPRVAGLTVTEVQVTADCRHANVFVTRMTNSSDKKSSDEEVENILDGIGRASGFFAQPFGKSNGFTTLPGTPL